MKKISKFRFKQFEVSHHRSALKVGVDGVLIGCWADASGARAILDVGTGCGLISLIMAQRFPDAMVTGIDVHEPSVLEARENVAGSPWPDRVEIRLQSFDDDFVSAPAERQFDFVISNPPFFDSGLSEVSTPREMARHQSALSPASLLRLSPGILTGRGQVAMIVPLEASAALEAEAPGLGYTLRRKCLVRGHAQAPWKRVLLQWQLGCGDSCGPIQERSLTLETVPLNPTEEYRELCRDFYLKF